MMKLFVVIDHILLSGGNPQSDLSNQWRRHKDQVDSSYLIQEQEIIHSWINNNLIWSFKITFFSN
jgi:hypothetical protein